MQSWSTAENGKWSKGIAIEDIKSRNLAIYLPYRKPFDPDINRASKFRRERNERMKDLPVQEVNTPEARNAIRLKALPMLLAVILAEEYDWFQPQELIAHDDLEASVLEKLGLEPSSMTVSLFEAITDQMHYWNWQCLTYECGFQQFYARPEQQRATLITLWGNRKVLQAGQSFPSDQTCISGDLWDTEYADPFMVKDEDGYMRCSKDHDADSKLIDGYFEAHLVSHRCT